MEVEKRRERGVIEHVIAFFVFFYAIVMTSLVTPILLIIVYYSTFPLILMSIECRKFMLRILAKAINMQFITCVKIAGIRVRMSGEPLENLADRRALMLPNHLSLFDHFIFMSAADGFGIPVVGRWIFVIYNMWIYAPLGWLWSIYGNCFIDSVPPHLREQTMAFLRNHFDRLYHLLDLRWVCLYPEGSRLFLIQERNKEFERKNNLPHLQHCTYPRIGAAVSAIKVLGPDPKNPAVANNGKGAPLEFLVDVTLGYPDGVLPIKQIFLDAFLNGGGKPFAIHYEKFAMDPKWSDEEEFKKFMFERYQKKDQLLDTYYKTGKFASESKLAELPSTFVIVAFQLAQLLLAGFIGKLVLSAF